MLDIKTFTPSKRPTGYSLDVIHKTPDGEEVSTLAKWTGKPNRKRLNQWATDYHILLLGPRKYVGEFLGYIPFPYRIAILLTSKHRVEMLWEAK
jgi:hypothetical protein